MAKREQKPLPAKNLKLLQDLLKATEIQIQDLARLVKLEYQTMRSVLSGKALSTATRSKVNLFIKRNSLEGMSFEDMKLVVGKEETTSPRPVLREHIERIKSFIARTPWLRQVDVARMLDMKRSSFQDALIPGKRISHKNRLIVEQFGEKLKKIEKSGTKSRKRRVGKEVVLEDVEQRVERIKYLLLALRSDLSFFESSKEARKVFRQLLNAGDVGFVGCLLTELTGSEDQFKRWLDRPSYQFNFFRRKG